MLESLYRTKKNQPDDALGSYLSAQAPPPPITMPQPASSGAAIGGTGNGPYYVPGFSDNPVQAMKLLLASNASTKQKDTGGDGPKLPHTSFDYSSDPVLQKMLLGGQADEADADTAALAARRSVLSSHGDRGLAASVLGADDPTLASISDNPDVSTSTLARLKRAYGDTVKSNEDSFNENNLWYGGFRAKKLGDLARDEATNEGDASAQVQSALDQIASGLSSTKKGIRDRNSQAETDAADRAREQAILDALLNGGATSGTGTDSAGADVGAITGPSTNDPSAQTPTAFDPTLPIAQQPTSVQEAAGFGYPIQPDGSTLMSDVTAPEPLPPDSTFGNGSSLEHFGSGMAETFSAPPPDGSAAADVSAPAPAPIPPPANLDTDALVPAGVNVPAGYLGATLTQAPAPASEPYQAPAPAPAAPAPDPVEELYRRLGAGRSYMV